MIVKIAEQNFEFDLSKSIGQRELLDKLFLAYRNKFPFFINLLISICEIKNVEQENKFALAYTKLNIDSERIDIFLNFEKMEKKEFTAEEFLYLIFHELLHNYFYHYSKIIKTFLGTRLLLLSLTYLRSNITKPHKKVQTFYN